MTSIDKITTQPTELNAFELDAVAAGEALIKACCSIAGPSLSAATILDRLEKLT